MLKNSYMSAIYQIPLINRIVFVIFDMVHQISTISTNNVAINNIYLLHCCISESCLNKLKKEIKVKRKHSISNERKYEKFNFVDIEVFLYAFPVYLRGTKRTELQNKFTHFILSVINEQPGKDVTSPSIGSLQLYGDSLTKFSERCQNAVVETNSQPKSEIQVYIYIISNKLTLSHLFKFSL